jgi:hypothetical protein
MDARVRDEYVDRAPALLQFPCGRADALQIRQVDPHEPRAGPRSLTFDRGDSLSAAGFASREDRDRGDATCELDRGRPTDASGPARDDYVLCQFHRRSALCALFRRGEGREGDMG